MALCLSASCHIPNSPEGLRGEEILIVAVICLPRSHHGGTNTETTSKHAHRDSRKTQSHVTSCLVMCLLYMRWFMRHSRFCLTWDCLLCNTPTINSKETPKHTSPSPISTRGIERDNTDYQERSLPP